MIRPELERYRIPSLGMACQALRQMADSSEPVTPTSLAKSLGMSRTTAFRMLCTLVCEGLVEETAGGYRLGEGMLRLGIRALERVDVRTHAVPVLRNLAQTTGETAHLAILVDTQILILEVCDSPNPLRVASRPGSLVDPHCSSTGKVLLAHLPEPRCTDLLSRLSLQAYTKNTATTVATVRERLDLTLAQGYGIDDEEYMLGIRCLAVPVRDRQNTVIAALGITGAAARVTTAALPDLIAQVQAAGTLLTRALGGSSTPV